MNSNHLAEETYGGNHGDSTVKGKAIPKFDHALITFLGTPEVDSISGQSIRQFGIENGEGEIYRIVGAENDTVYATLIERLRDLRYRIEPLQDQDFRISRRSPGRRRSCKGQGHHAHQGRCASLYNLEI